MTNYQAVRLKLANTQFENLKSAKKKKKKKKTETILRLHKKNFENEELSHELFLTTRQTTITRNGFANNM